MNEAKCIARIEKNSKEIIRIGLDEFKGYRLLSARVWAKTDNADEVPTRAGLTVRVEQGEAVIQGLIQALDEARSRGWIK